MERLLLLSLVTRPWTPGFRTTLETLDVGTENVERIEDARAAWATGRFPGLIVAGEPADDDEGNRLGMLLATAGMPSLAVVATAPNNAMGWLRFAGDVAFWPAATHELAFRVGRLTAARDAAPRVEPRLARMLAAADLVGTSTAFLRALRALPEIVNCDASVLICGETGTGKDVVARAIHYLGPRKGGPFVPVNCAALPENLFENELFGHVRGAYTNAAMAQDGLAAQAHTGTLVLDEVDTLSPRSQAALLQFLQDGRFRPLGAGPTRASDARIVAATNRKLEDLVGSGLFREDLFYRLNVLCLTLPPLRERREDIAMLARHMVAHFSRRYGRTKQITAATARYIAAQPWHGNVRELENWVHRRFLLSAGQTVDADETAAAAPDTPASVPSAFRAAKHQAIADFERRYLLDLIAATAGNVSEASRRARTERRALGRLLQKHGIDPAVYRRSADEMSD